MTLPQNNEAHCLKAGSQIICGSSQVQHDGTVSRLPETDELIVLAEYLRRSFREIEGEGSLVGTEVIDVEYQLLGQILGRAPHNPTHTRIYKSVLVTRDVDRDDFLETKVPLETWVHKWCHEPSTSTVNVNRTIDILLD